MYMYTAKGLYLKNNPENNIKLKRFIEIWGGIITSKRYHYIEFRKSDGK
jgi:hypothetical protein